MISFREVEIIHSLLIERFGGSKGVRDKAGLESGLNRPFQTFDQQELYSTAIEKAAAIFESTIINHPFVDGNKRTSYVLMRLILMKENILITASENSRYDFVISAAEGKLKFEGIKAWLIANSRQVRT